MSNDKNNDNGALFSLPIGNIIGNAHEHMGGRGVSEDLSLELPTPGRELPTTPEWSTPTPARDLPPPQSPPVSAEPSAEISPPHDVYTISGFPRVDVVADLDTSPMAQMRRAIVELQDRLCEVMTRTATLTPSPQHWQPVPSNSSSGAMRQLAVCVEELQRAVSDLQRKVK